MELKRKRLKKFIVSIEFLHDLQEFSQEEERLYAGLGREFLSVIETTDMQKVYKMPILYSFYHNGGYTVGSNG